MSLTPEKRRELGMMRGEMKPFIYHELGLRNLNATKIAEELGCSVVNVSNTILGLSHSPRVLDAIRNAAVPEKYLFDPREIAKKPKGHGFDIREKV